MRRFLQFRVSTILMFVFVCAILFAWWHDRQDFHRKLDEAEAKLQQSELLREAERMVMQEDQQLLFMSQANLTMAFQEWQFPGQDATVKPFEEYSPIASLLSFTLQGGKLTPKKPKPTQTAMKELVERLGSDDNLTRARAARTLANFGASANPAVSALVDALKDEDVVRWHAAWALRKLSKDLDVSAAIPELQRLIEGQSMPAFAAQVLRTIDPTKKNTSRLIELLGHDKGDTRRRAATELGEIGDKRALPGLKRLLRDENNDVRKEAITAVGNLASRDDALATLTEMFSRETDKDVKLHAARVLAKLDED